MKQRKGYAHFFYAPVIILLGIAFLAHSGLISYVIFAPKSIKKQKISKIKYGPVKISGIIDENSIKYGQVDTSKAIINDKTGKVKIVFGRFERIVDPKKKYARENVDVEKLGIPRAKKIVNRPLNYDAVDVIGIYYPLTKSVYAYHIRGRVKGAKFKISGSEYSKLPINILLGIIFIVFGMYAIVKK